MAKQTINIGSSEQAGDGESLRSAFDKINDNFDELYLKDTTDFDGQFSSLAGTPTTLAGYGITDAATTAQGALAATAVQPQTSLSGYGITDAYTKAEVDSEIATATASLTIQSGSTHSIDIVAADSTVLVDSVNGTLNATTLTGALPAIDGSALTGITTAFSNITSTPTTISGYGISDAQPALVSGTNIKTVNGQTLLGSGNIVISGGGGGTGDVTGSVFADDSTLLVDGVNGTLNSSALTKPIALADNEKIIFGNDDDLEIFHNASNGNTIIENNTGNLVIKGSNLFLQSASSEYFFRGAANGAVTLYYDNVAKLDTTADGISVTGKITGLTDPTAAQDAATKAYVDANSGGGAETDPIVGAITGIVKADGAGNISAAVAGTDYSTFDGAFGSLTGTPTTLAGYGITDALTLGGALTGSSLEAVAVGAGVADGNDLAISGGDATEINSTGGDANITGGSGALASGNVNIGTTQTVAVSIGASGVGTSIGGTLTANGNAIFNTGVQEKFATLTGSTGVTAMDCDNGQVFYLTGAAGDITANFTNLGLTAEYGTNVTVIINQGATPYEVTAVQIGGSGQTIEWQGGSAPTGNANGIDSFSFTILRDGGSYVVLGQMVDFT
jgi:hypothetical protein